MSPVVDVLLGGWSVAGINTVTAAEPITFTYAPATSFIVSGIASDFRGANNYRPNVGGDPYASGADQTITNWFNKASVVVPTDPSQPFGNAGRNTVRGPNFWVFDASVSKRVALGPQAKLEVRIEAFNLFNRANFTAPSGVRRVPCVDLCDLDQRSTAPRVAPRGAGDFVALAKAKPGQMNYGSAGNGSAGHLAFEYLKMVSDIFVLHVPYRGTGPQLTDLLAGRLDAASVGAPAILAHIKSGKLRCIATGTKERLPQLPDVPTVAESGYPGFEMTQWYGLNAPASMSQAAIDRIADACGKAMHNPQATERLRGDTAQPVGDTPAQYAAFIKSEQARWKQVVARAKIKPD